MIFESTRIYKIRILAKKIDNKMAIIWQHIACTGEMPSKKELQSLHVLLRTAEKRIADIRKKRR